MSVIVNKSDLHFMVHIKYYLKHSVRLGASLVKFVTAPANSFHMNTHELFTDPPKDRRIKIQIIQTDDAKLLRSETKFAFILSDAIKSAQHQHTST